MTEVPIFSRARGPPGRKADYRLLGRWTEGARPRRPPWAGAGPHLRHAGIPALAALGVLGEAAFGPSSAPSRRPVLAPGS